jgi:hypothetical protein
MRIRTLVLAAALAVVGVAQVQAHDGNRGRSQSRGYAGYGNGYYRPVLVQRPQVIVVPAPRYSPRHSTYDSYRSYPRYGYGSYGRGGYYGAPGYGWPGYVSSYPSGSLSLILSLPLR